MPPRKAKTRNFPTPGNKLSNVSGTEVTILQAQYPILSQGNEYPVTPKVNVMIANIKPEIQVTSRGFLKPPVK